MEVVVGMGDMKIARGDSVLATYALGSCVGVCMYDDELGIGGMLHAMLPKSKDIMNFSKKFAFELPSYYNIKGKLYFSVERMYLCKTI